MINKHKSNKIKENSNTVRHLNNGTDHRHSKSCCDQSSPARRTKIRVCCYQWIIGVRSFAIYTVTLAYALKPVWNDHLYKCLLGNDLVTFNTIINTLCHYVLKQVFNGNESAIQWTLIKTQFPKCGLPVFQLIIKIQCDWATSDRMVNSAKVSLTCH